jgi:RNA polymerase sigma-70 factor, ECF subfamily
MGLNTHTAVAEIESLYRQHGAALLLFATALIGDRSRAQDAVHEVFLKLIEDRNLQKATNKKAYVFTCVRNALLNETRFLRRTTSLEPNSPWFYVPEDDSSISGRNAELALRYALLGLPDDQRQVVILHIWVELTFLEIAEILEISHNTVASRYRYALIKLRELLSGSRAEKENQSAESR